MNKIDNYDLEKRAKRVGNMTTKTQVSEKFQAKPKYELEYKQVNDLISMQIDPYQRRIEFQKYLELFGYKPERTIIQVHIAWLF